MNKFNKGTTVYHYLALTEEDVQYVTKRRLITASLRAAAIIGNLFTCGLIVRGVDVWIAAVVAILSALAVFMLPLIENDLIEDWVLGGGRQCRDAQLLDCKARELQRERAYRALARELSKPSK